MSEIDVLEAIENLCDEDNLEELLEIMIYGGVSWEDVFEIALKCNSFGILKHIFENKLANPPSDKKILTSVILETGMGGYGEEIMELLLKNGAFSKKSINESLVKACLWGRSSAVKILLSHGADPNFDGGKPLREAVIERNDSVVKTLLEDDRIDPTLNDHKILIEALPANPHFVDVTSFEMLLKDGRADPRVNENDLLRLATVKFAKLGNLKPLQLLLLDGRVDPLTSNGIFLSNASTRDYYDVVDLILRDPHVWNRPKVRLYEGLVRACLKDKKYDKLMLLLKYNHSYINYLDDECAGSRLDKFKVYSSEKIDAIARNRVNAALQVKELLAKGQPVDVVKLLIYNAFGEDRLLLYPVDTTGGLKTNKQRLLDVIQQIVDTTLSIVDEREASKDTIKRRQM